MTTATIPSPAVTATEAPSSLRLGALVALGGVALMIAGAVALATTDTDLWKALSDGSISTYLADAQSHRTTMFVQLSLWIAGAVAIGTGGTILAARASGAAAQLARVAYQLGAGLAVVAFISWMGLIRVAERLDPTTGELIGFVATRLDDLATIALVGVAPAALALESTWMGRRLRLSAIVVAATAALALVASIIDASPTLGFLLVPVGLGWTLAAAIAALRTEAAAA